MTDQVAVQQPPSQPKEEKKPTTSNASNQNRSPKKQNKSSNPSQGRRKPSSAAGESGSETGGVRKGNDSSNRRTSENRGKPQGNRGGQKNRLPSQGRPSNSNGQPVSRQASKSNASTPVPANSAETIQPSPMPPTEVVSSLPANAPVFQPGMQIWPGSAQSNDQARHRKAASVGTSYSNNSLANFAPNLGVMMEDAEDPAAYEDADIQGDLAFRQQQQNHTRRSLSQSFTAPRFAALAQQEQGEVLGPTGRPQLAPGFMFGGARRRGSSNGPMGPPINEDDVGFQFPQQQTRSLDAQGLPRPDESSGEITGIMAEQIAIQKQIEVLQQQQQALYQQQLASNQILSLQTGLAPNRPSAHRRVQSTVPIGLSAGNNIFGAPVQNTAGQLGNLSGLGMGLDGQTSGIPRGHGRRHSVNVLNKAAGQNIGSLEDGNFEPFEDGFNPPGQQQRATSITQSGSFAQELAHAQAQLTSLQQFRAASGGHHHKMPSFSFPNMLPNMMAANMMGLGSGVNFLQQQTQQFQSQLQQQSNQPQRKSLFAPYLPQASLPPLLAAGKLVVGILRVNKRNRSDAYVSTEVLDADIYICGSKDRNRALEGDIVAVELLDVDEVWATKKEKEEKKRKKEENSAYESKSAAGRKNDKKKDDVEVEGQGLMLFEDEEVTDEIKPQFAGHVVAVVERMPGQLFSGTLGLLRPSSAATKEKQEAERREREGDRGDEPRRPIERPKIVWFKPTDKRVPLIAIPTEQAPADFVQSPEAYANKLFVACIKRHPISSLHPFGTLVEELGPIGDIEVETSALLKDCNFPTEEFSENVLKCLPPTPWVIPERELEGRRDLRQERIFTIDPTGAKDLDDALSVKANDDGTYDIGVHVADVSYFVKPNTALDRDAKKRATSVYLVQRAVPMLPPILSEELCSLNFAKDRLAFSVIFTMTKEAKVTKKWFGRTVIRSSAQLSYANAQDAIEGKLLGDVPVAPEHDASAIEHDIKILHEIAQVLKDRRFKSGALSADTPKLSFTLDGTGKPIDCDQSAFSDANALIQELMLLTNVAVAEQVAVNFPEQALLRRNDLPLERRLKGFQERAEGLGYKIDISSSGAIMKSLEAVRDPGVRQILELLSRKSTAKAKYFCAGMLDIAKYQHYALATPLYTHFTSPIRRYADVLVHRQLDSILQAGGELPKFALDRDAVAKVAQQCNIKKECARLAQEQSAHLYLSVLISDLTQRYGPVVRQARVVGVLDAAFDVLIPEFGIEKRVHVDQMPIDNHVFDEHTRTLQIYWSDKDVIGWLAANSDDEHLKKVHRTAEQNAMKMEVASGNVNDEHALFEEDDDEDDEIVIGRTNTKEDLEVVETSKQMLLSMAQVEPVFEGLKTPAAGHKIQEIKELMSVPVIVTADLTKSPPVIKVYSVNPFAQPSNKRF